MSTLSFAPAPASKDDPALARYEHPIDELAYRLEIEGAPPLGVMDFTIHERLNATGFLKVEILANSGPVNPEELLGKMACFQMAVGDHGNRSVRFYHGYVEQFGRNVSGRGRRRFTAKIVPRVGLLRWKRRSRVLASDPTQQRTAKEIISRILMDSGIHGSSLDLSGLNGGHPVYSFLTQYEETDWNLLLRLCEHEGIGFAIDHRKTEDVVVFFDDSRSRPAAEPFRRVLCRPPAGALDDRHEVVSDFDVSHALTHDAVEVRDMNFRNSHKPIVGQPRDLSSGADRENYRFPGPFQETTDPTKEMERLAQLRHEAFCSAAEAVAVGEGDYRSISAGRAFDIEEVSGKTSSWLCIEATHHGSQRIDELDDGRPARGGGIDYSMRFLCQPADLIYRPTIQTPQPRVAGSQTATVVGQKGEVTAVNNEEIYTDEYGRVRVHLHWDRDWKPYQVKSTSHEQEDTSFWIRVSQQCAGRGWGTFFLPRIGQEVVVDFLNGDPNQPIITASVHNDYQRTPYQLPKHKTRSTIKTNSTPGGKGFNEIRFEDRKGAEQLFIHAQNSHDLRVGGTSKTSIGADQHTTIGHEDDEGNRRGNQHVRVHKDRHQIVGASSFDEVIEDRGIWTNGSVLEDVGVNHIHRVKQGEYRVIAKTIHVAADESICLSVGCKNFIVIDQTGINIVGLPNVNINSGGVPLPPAAAEPADETKWQPVSPSAADSDRSGERSTWDDFAKNSPSQPREAV